MMEAVTTRIKAKHQVEFLPDVELSLRCEGILRWRDSEAFELNNRGDDSEAFRYGVFFINKDWTKCTMLIFLSVEDALAETQDIMRDYLQADEAVTIYCNAQLG